MQRNTPQYTALDHNTPQYTAIHHNTLQYTAIHCNTPQYTAIHHNTPQYTSIHRIGPQYTAIHSTYLPDGMQRKRKKTVICICTYAPPETSSNKNQEERNNYYQELEDIIRSVPLSSMLIICGDMNAKTGSGHQLYPSVIGEYGKGQTNNNGQQLIDICSRNELYITNAFFDYKMAHRTTWICPEHVQDHKDKDGNIRWNPYINQIDYIMTRTQYKTLVTDSRSYAGFKQAQITIV